MKSFTLVLALSTLLTGALSTPLVTESAPLEVRAGPYCHTKADNTPCRYGAASTFDVKRRVDKSENVGGNCKVYNSAGNTWIWVPGWSCWIWADNLNAACAGQQPGC